jgi:glucoamylase
MLRLERLPRRRQLPSQPSGRRTFRRIRWMAAGIAVALAATAIILAVTSRPPGVPPLYAQGIAQRPCGGGRVLVVPAAASDQYEADSSVVRTQPEPACARAAVRADQHWLSAGLIPGTGALRSMAVRALLDLHLSTRANGAVVAGWHPGWEYTWPRDSSWVAVALADTGHPADSYRILRFLQRMQLPDGTWAARYWPDGAGPVRDGRPRELDADGWLPWAVWSWGAAAGASGHGGRQQLAALWPMVRAAADASVRALSDGLPAASMDYWEDSVTVTLGTAAPLLAGLRAAAAIARELGRDSSAPRWDSAAATLARGIRLGFGGFGYGRLPYQRSGADAAITFLGPPFGPPGPGLGRAVSQAEQALRLPNGGLVPGADWPGSKMTAWTAETAFFALFDAEAGQHQAAARILAWLARHRTRLGALPEMVSAAGRPVSVAPLAWTDAVVLLTLTAQAHPLPTVPAGA